MELRIVRRRIPEWGTSYGPPGAGPFPAIMLLHGSEGAWSGWSHRNAMLLAAHGFLAFPFPYSQGGNAWNAGSIIDTPLDRGVDALAALRGFPASAGGPVGLYGVSRGAEYALLMTSLMAREGLPGQPEAVAVHSPPDVICGGFDARHFRDSGDPGWRAWDGAMRAWTWRGRSDHLLPTTPIDIEAYEGPVMLSHGTRDQMWSVAMTRRLEARLRGHGRTPRVHYFEGEDHVLGSEAENRHHGYLLDFLAEHL